MGVAENEKRLFILLFSLTVWFSLIESVNALETVTVPPYGELLRTLNLNVGDRVNGTCLVDPAIGGFYVLGPGVSEHKLVGVWSITSDKPVSFSFTARTTGEYIIRYWNTDKVRSTRVILDYTAPSELPDYLQGAILQIAVVIIVLVISLVVAYLWRPKSKRIALKAA